MMTVETMRRIAPKQGDTTTEDFIYYTSMLLETKGLEYVLSWLERGTTRNENVLQVAFQPMHKQMLQIMKAPDDINEWTPIGE